MRVLLLGAGASQHACYPLASKLLTKVEEHVNASALVNIRQAWRGWLDFRDSCPEYLQFLVRNNNPEIVFTLPTLLQVAADAEDSYRTSSAFKEAEVLGAEEPAAKLQTYYDSSPRSPRDE